ncbi:sorbitol dehydrogenase [Sodiomyces alkalinus F11]|uniref:Sorbitol dehydrogenase n=1 Tax=Sodiomyces alkalinus (strain CBS 110278 / VKM F-3762 / F11) TaxID=1314773 RepID=A0A3N2Q1I7_SODAK|nr:sorbitol dehydrogenase [Sodiomyces alkalinus F11]ROT40614.1 sorbitol dehydrogenase [Sodiomyces alkalinus F11]
MAPAATESEPLPVQLPIYGSKGSAVNASVLHGPGDLRLETRRLKDPAVGELQIAIKTTGICGSDVSYYKKFANGDLCACHPLSLGHESSGVVVAIGPQVKGFKLGDRVALEVGVPCSHCATCRKGRYNLCKKLRFRSSAKTVPHYQGTLQERINHPAAWCHKIPNHVSFDAAALLEPLSVAIHAVNRAAASPGSSALVIGAGTVGLLTAVMARQAGCSSVVITDIDAGRVDYAISKGFATHGYVVPQSPNRSPNSSNPPSGIATPTSSGASTPASIFSVQNIQTKFDGAKSLAAELLAQMKFPRSLGQDETINENDDDDDDDDDDEHDGFDVSFECTGKEVCMQTSLYATKPGGKVIMVGMGTPVQTLPLSVAHLREIDILGIFRYANTYPTGVQLLCAKNRAGIPSLDDMVTHRFKGLHNASKAFELASRTVDDDGNLVLKVVIEA